MQHFQHPLPGAQVYPIPQIKQKYEKLVEDPDYEPERQCLGHSISVVLALLAIIISLPLIMRSIFGVATCASACFAGCGVFMLYFQVTVLFYPEYLGGKPEMYKAWPLFAAWTCYTAADVLSEPDEAASYIAMDSALALVHYLITFQDDTSGSCFLCLKPWVYRKKHDVPPVQTYGQAHYQTGPYVPQGYPNPYPLAPAQDRPGRQ